MTTSVTYDLIAREAERVEQLKAHYLKCHGWTPVAGHDGRLWKHDDMCDHVALNTDGAVSLAYALLEKRRHDPT